MYINIKFVGKSLPRQSINSNHALPSPLDVASTLQTIPPKKHESITSLLGAWSELILHDLASTGNLKSQDCCSEDGVINHSECYGRLGNGQCRDYMRTLPAVANRNCPFGKYTQLITLYIKHLTLLLITVVTLFLIKVIIYLFIIY